MGKTIYVKLNNRYAELLYRRNSADCIISSNILFLGAHYFPGYSENYNKTAMLNLACGDHVCVCAGKKNI